jgi:hypothetical protein
VDAGAVDTVVEEWLASTGAPSASIAIVQEGRLTYARRHDAAPLDERSNPDGKFEEFMIVKRED